MPLCVMWTLAAQELARSGRVEALLGAALGGPGARDALLWKLLRNVAGHESAAVKLKFAASLPGIVALLQVWPGLRCPLPACRMHGAAPLQQLQAGRGGLTSAGAQ